MLVICAVGNLYVAAKIGAALGLSFRDVLGIWLAPGSTSAYLGAHLKSVLYVERALFFGLIAVFAAASAWVAYIDRSRAQRIIRALKQSGAW